MNLIDEEDYLQWCINELSDKGQSDLNTDQFSELVYVCSMSHHSMSIIYWVVDIGVMDFLHTSLYVLKFLQMQLSFQNMSQLSLL